jgi:hypothetical protein
VSKAVEKLDKGPQTPKLYYQGYADMTVAVKE